MISLCTLRFQIDDRRRLKKALEYSGVFKGLRFAGSYTKLGDVLVPPTEIGPNYVSRIILNKTALGLWKVLNSEGLPGVLYSFTFVMEKSDFYPPVEERTEVFFVLDEVQMEDVGREGIVQEGVVIRSGPNHVQIETSDGKRVAFSPGSGGAFWVGEKDEIWEAFPSAMRGGGGD